MEPNPRRAASSDSSTARPTIQPIRLSDPQYPAPEIRIAQPPSRPAVNLSRARRAPIPGASTAVPAAAAPLQFIPPSSVNGSHTHSHAPGSLPEAGIHPPHTYHQYSSSHHPHFAHHLHRSQGNPAGDVRGDASHHHSAPVFPLSSASSAQRRLPSGRHPKVRKVAHLTLPDAPTPYRENIYQPTESLPTLRSAQGSERTRMPHDQEAALSARHSRSLHPAAAARSPLEPEQPPSALGRPQSAASASASASASIHSHSLAQARMGSVDPMASNTPPANLRFTRPTRPSIQTDRTRAAALQHQSVVSPQEAQENLRQLRELLQNELTSTLHPTSTNRHAGTQPPQRSVPTAPEPSTSASAGSAKHKPYDPEAVRAYMQRKLAERERLKRQMEEERLERERQKRAKLEQLQNYRRMQRKAPSVPQKPDPASAMSLSPRISGLGSASAERLASHGDFDFDDTNENHGDLYPELGPETEFRDGIFDTMALDDSDFDSEVLSHSPFPQQVPQQVPQNMASQSLRSHVESVDIANGPHRSISRRQQMVSAESESVGAKYTYRETAVRPDAGTSGYRAPSAHSSAEGTGTHPFRVPTQTAPATERKPVPPTVADNKALLKNSYDRLDALLRTAETVQSQLSALSGRASYQRRSPPAEVAGIREQPSVARVEPSPPPRPPSPYNQYPARTESPRSYSPPPKRPLSAASSYSNMSQGDEAFADIGVGSFRAFTKHYAERRKSMSSIGTAPDADAAAEAFEIQKSARHVPDQSMASLDDHDGDSELESSLYDVSYSKEHEYALLDRPGSSRPSFLDLAERTPPRSKPSLHDLVRAHDIYAPRPASPRHTSGDPYSTINIFERKYRQQSHRRSSQSKEPLKALPDGYPALPSGTASPALSSISDIHDAFEASTGSVLVKADELQVDPDHGLGADAARLQGPVPGRFSFPASADVPTESWIRDSVNESVIEASMPSIVSEIEHVGSKPAVGVPIGTNVQPPVTRRPVATEQSMHTTATSRSDQASGRDPTTSTFDSETTSSRTPSGTSYSEPSQYGRGFHHHQQQQHHHHHQQPQQQHSSHAHLNAGLRLSPRSLSRKLMAEIRVLEVIEESRVQLEQLDHYRGVTIAQQETVALSQLMLDRQRRHEMDLKLAQLDRERQEEQHRSRRVPSPPQGHDHEYSSASFEDISSLGSSEGSSDTATPDLDRYKVAPGRSPDPRLDAVDADIAEEIGQDTAQDESVVYIEPVSEAVIEDESSAPEMMEVDEHQAADDQRTRLHHDTTSLSASGNLAMELKRRELVLEERLKAELHAIQLDRQRHATDPRHDDLGHSLEHALYMQYAAEKAEIALKWNAALREERQEKSAIATAEQLTAQHASAPESVLEPITSGVDVAEPSERTQPAECVKGPVADFGITPVDEAINLIATLNKQGHDFRVPIPPPLSMPGTEFSKQTSHGSSALPADAAQSPLPGSPIQSADAGALSYRPEESFMSIEEDVPLDLGSVEIDAERVSAQTAQSLMSTEEPVVSVTETSFQAGRSAPPPAIAAFGRESDSDSSLLRGKIELARQTVQSDAIERKKAKLAESRKLAEGLLEERLNQDRQRRELKRETKEISRLLDKILSPAPLHQGTESRSVSAEVPGAAAHSIQAPAEGFAIASLQGQLTASKYTPVVARADTAVKPIPTSGSVSQDHHRHASIPESIDFVSDAAESLGSIAESVVVESEIATPVALQPSEQPVHIQHDPTAVTLSAIQPPDQSTAPEVATDEIIEEQSAQPISSVASSGVPLSARDSARFGASLLEAPVGGMASDGRPAEIVSQVQHPDLQYTSIVADTEPQYPTDFEDFEKSAAAEEQEDSLSLEDLEIKTRILALQKEVLLKRKQADELLQKKQLQRTLAKQKMYEAELKLKSELSLLDHFIEKTSTEIDHLGGPSKSIDQLPPFDINDVKRTGKAKSSVSPGPNVPQVGSASQTPASHSTHPIDAEPRAMSPRVPDTLPASEYAAKTSPPPEESLIEEHISQANSVDMSAADSISSFHVDVREPIIPDDRADAVSRTAADAPGADVDMNEVEESIVSTPATDNSQVDRMSLEQPVPTTIEHAAKALAIGSAAPVDGSMDLSMPEEHAEVSVAYSDDAFESLDLRPDDSEQAYQASQTPTNIPNHQPVEQPSVDRLRKSKTPHDPQQPETSTVLVSEVSEDIQEDIVPEEPRCESQDDIALEGSGHLELQAAQNVAEISSEMAQDAVRRRDSDAVSQPASQSSLKDAALSDNDAAAGSHPPITAKVEALPSSHVPMDEYPELFETDHISEEIEGRSEGAIAEQALTIDQPLEPATGTSQLASAPASNEPEPHLRAGDLDADTVDEVQSAPIDSQMLSSCDQRAAEPAHGKEAEDMDHAMGQEAEDQRLDTFSQPLIRDVDLSEMAQPIRLNGRPTTAVHPSDQTPADSPTEKSLFSDQDLAPVPLGSELESVIPNESYLPAPPKDLVDDNIEEIISEKPFDSSLELENDTNRKVVSSELTSEARYISGLSTESLISIREHLAIPTEELDQAPGKELAQVLTEAASNVWPDMPSEAIAEKPAGGLPAESQGVALSKPETRPGVNSTNRLGSKSPNEPLDVWDTHDEPLMVKAFDKPKTEPAGLGLDSKHERDEEGIPAVHMPATEIQSAMALQINADHRNEQMAEHICDVIFEPLLDGSVEAMLKLRHHVAATGNVARDNSAAEQQLALDARPEQPQSQAQYNESVVDIITDMILADILKDPALDALSKNQDAPAAETATVQGQSAPPTEYIQTETQPIESEGEQPVALPEAIVLKPTVEAHTTIVEPRPPSEPTEEAASLTPEYALGVVDLILKEYEAHKASVSKQQGVTPALHSTYISRRFMRTLSQSTPFRNPIFNQLVVDAFNQATKEMAPFTNQSISQLLICHKTAVTASTSTDIQNVKSIIVDWMLYSKEYGENLDALLIKEVKVQERRWLNTDLMAPLVKEQCAESIWQRLLEDTVACVRRTTQAKW